jgi:formylglycine-generating enzyme
MPLCNQRKTGRLMWLQCMVSMLGAMIWLAACGQLHAQSESGKPLKTVSNSIGMSLVRIDPGEFWMGALLPAEEVAELFKAEGATAREFTTDYPRHKVQITKPFFMGQHEVTVGQFHKFVAETNYVSDAQRDGLAGTGWNQQTKKMESGLQYTWLNPGWTTYDDTHPVVNVSWNDAQRFCRWLSQKEKTPYRLPTEAEWEYACRAGTQTLYWNGDAPEKLTQIANVGDTTAQEKFPELTSSLVKTSDGFVFTAPVGSFAANPWGLYDMHGNVAEFVADVYNADAYRGRAGTTTVDPLVISGSESHPHRGGHFKTSSRSVRSAVRTFFVPGLRSNNVGFRVVSAAGP